MKKFFVLVALVATLIPVIFVVYKVGGWQNWQGILPRGSTDSLYYYGRIKEVVDGYPLIGNPYAYEHREAFAPAFFLPDIVSAVPSLIGLPFNVAIIINMFMWSFVLLWLTYRVLRLLAIPKWWAAGWSVLSYILVYSLMLRPTVMQLVYPLFVAFLIVFLKFLYEPLVRRRAVWLALVSATTFYTYTYLAYLVILSFASVFFWFLFGRRYQELKAVVISGVYSAVALIPFGIITMMQMKSPYYFETLKRIGLIYTHVPSIEAFFYGRWVVIGLVAFGLIWKFFPKQEEGRAEQKIFWLSTGISLLAVSILNVFTGVEMTLAVHVGRFVILWVAMILGALLYEWYASRTSGAHKVKYLIVAVFLLVLSGGVLRNIGRGLSFFEFNNRGQDLASLQSMASPLEWFEENVINESVIWSNDVIAEYIPVVTRHYPLFSEGAALHNISAEELEDRYLLSQSLHTLTIEDLKKDFAIYAGRGPAKEEPRIKHIDAITLRGEEYFKEMEKRFIEIKKNQSNLLKQYNVKYLIIDRAHDNFEPLSFKEALYDDGRFVILSLPL